MTRLRLNSLLEKQKILSHMPTRIIHRSLIRLITWDATLSGNVSNAVSGETLMILFLESEGQSIIVLSTSISLKTKEMNLAITNGNHLKIQTTFVRLFQIQLSKRSFVLSSNRLSLEHQTLNLWPSSQRIGFNGLLPSWLAAVIPSALYRWQ